MLSKARTAAIGLAAALAAVTLAGATTRAPATHVPVERHRCQCRGHPGAPCECPECRRAAQEALSERPHAGFEPPAIGCACGEPGEPVMASASADPCRLAAEPVVAVAGRTESLRPGGAASARDGPVQPETPPPIDA